MKINSNFNIMNKKMNQQIQYPSILFYFLLTNNFCEIITLLRSFGS